MINCDGQFHINYISQANLDDIKTWLPLINYPEPVRSLRVHPIYWWKNTTKTFIQAIHYIRQPKWQLMLSLPNNHADQSPISCGTNGVGSGTGYDIDPTTNPYDATTSVARATETLEYFLDFKISFRKFQVNEPFSGEYADNGGGTSKVLPARSDWNAIYTLAAYRAALNAHNLTNRMLYGCLTPKTAAMSGYPNYMTPNTAIPLTSYTTSSFPRDEHLAKQKEYQDSYDSIWTNRYPAHLANKASFPKYIICSECGTWDSVGFATNPKTATWESDEMIQNAVDAEIISADLSNEFCWHDLWGNHISEDGTSYSLFHKEDVLSQSFHRHAIIEQEFIK